MNKKDLFELRKNFADTGDLLVMNHVVTAFVNSGKEICCRQSRPYFEIPADERECFWETVRHVLSGTLGKGLLEYEFPNDAEQEGGSRYIFETARASKFEDEAAVTAFLDQIVNHLDFVSNYAIVAAHCTYTVFKKSRNGEKDPYQSYDYSFIITAVCPVSLRIDGLIYNRIDNIIEKKSEYDQIVAEIPTDGFLYPTFTGRNSDTHHVLYHAKKPKEINVSIIEGVLGCRFTMTAQEQKETFQSILEEVVAEELDYHVITGVNGRLREIAAETANDADLTTVDEIHVRDILLDTGVSAEKAEEMRARYRRETEENPITLGNLLENKTTIQLDGITITVQKDSEEKVRIKEEKDRRYLLIDLDDPAIKINGITAKFARAE